jgi:hypothetical protein
MIVAAVYDRQNHWREVLGRKVGELIRLARNFKGQPLRGSSTGTKTMDVFYVRTEARAQRKPGPAAEKFQEMISVCLRVVPARPRVRRRTDWPWRRRTETRKERGGAFLAAD